MLSVEANRFRAAVCRFPLPALFTRSCPAQVCNRTNEISLTPQKVGSTEVSRVETSGVGRKSVEFRYLGQLRCAPSSSQGFDQQNAGVHATPQDVDIVSFILQRDRLRRENLKVRVRSANVPICENLKIPSHSLA